MNKFLPLTKEDIQAQGWYDVDFVCITGDSYVDHPSFGIAVISRLLQSMGYRVGIIAQPQSDTEYQEFGIPRYGFMITSGNIDSMVSHYTTNKRKRSEDAYTAGGKAGNRPDRALTVYSKAVRRLYPHSAIVLGGLEASFRRFAHYDYWADTVFPSVLESSQADLLVYGMGEHQTREIATRLARGERVTALTNIRGTCYFADGFSLPRDAVTCASYNRVSTDKEAFSKAYKMQGEEQDAVYGKTIIQQHDNGRYLIQNQPGIPLTTAELDDLYTLPFQRMYHPSYEEQGGVPAIEEVEFSIIQNRGCYGGCNFCAISFHQGRAVTSRSKESIVKEGEDMTQNPRFKGYIHDVGGPTANFRGPSCRLQEKDGVCKHRKCLVPQPCENLVVDHREFLEILRELRNLKGVKKVFVRSGIRFDYLNLEKDPTFLEELVTHHVSGQLKVAPEHSSKGVLQLMGKPSIEAFDIFKKNFYKATKKAGKEQYLVPYLMSSHPGATLKDAVELALYLKANNLRPEQVQDFYPTPGTASTSMFYTGLNPFTGKKVYVAKSAEDKNAQRGLLQYYNPKNHEIIRKALVSIHRTDLIGFGAEALVPPGKGGMLLVPAEEPTKGKQRGKNPFGKERRKHTKPKRKR